MATMPAFVIKAIDNNIDVLDKIKPMIDEAIAIRSDNRKMMAAYLEYGNRISQNTLAEGDRICKEADLIIELYKPKYDRLLSMTGDVLEFYGATIIWLPSMQKHIVIGLEEGS